MAFAITLSLLVATAHAQIIDTEDGMVAGIPVNYTEARTGAYSLPDRLQLANGRPVTDARTWFEQRALPHPKRAK